VGENDDEVNTLSRVPEEPSQFVTSAEWDCKSILTLDVITRNSSCAADNGASTWSSAAIARQHELGTTAELLR
jgi:hypothetical protein